GEKFLLLRAIAIMDSPCYLIETDTGKITQMAKDLDFHNVSSKDEILVFATHKGTSICKPGTGSPHIIKYTCPIALAPDGSHLLAFRDGRWEGRRGYLLWKLPVGKPDKWKSFELRERPACEILKGTIFSPDSKKLAVVSLNNEDVEVTFWDVLANRQVS